MKAFPCEKYQIDAYGNKQPMGKEAGMDLRDYFAAKAMQAILVTRNDAMYLKELPTICYKWADAMMEARKNETR